MYLLKENIHTTTVKTNMTHLSVNEINIIHTVILATFPGIK